MEEIVMSATNDLASKSAEPYAAVLDPEMLCIRRGAQSFELSKKAVAILCLLRSNPRRFIDQHEILDAIWPNTYVQPEIVKTYIKQIRQAVCAEN